LTTASDGIISNVVSAKLRQGVKPRPFTASGALINLFHDDAADSTTDSATAIAVRHFAENAASCLALALVRFPSLETLAPDDPRYRTCAIRTDDGSFYLALRRTYKISHRDASACRMLCRDSFDYAGEPLITETMKSRDHGTLDKSSIDHLASQFETQKFETLPPIMRADFATRPASLIPADHSHDRTIELFRVF